MMHKRNKELFLNIDLKLFTTTCNQLNLESIG